MAHRVWMIFDLGLDGPYDALYAWLDRIGAVDCGEGACSFTIDPGKAQPGAAILAELKKSKVKLRSHDRLYLVWKGPGGMTGKFIHGGRKRAPWAGFHVEAEQEGEDAA